MLGLVAHEVKEHDLLRYFVSLKQTRPPFGGPKSSIENQLWQISSHHVTFSANCSWRGSKAAVAF